MTIKLNLSISDKLDLFLFRSGEHTGLKHLFPFIDNNLDGGSVQKDVQALYRSSVQILSSGSGRMKLFPK